MVASSPILADLLRVKPFLDRKHPFYALERKFRSAATLHFATSQRLTDVRRPPASREIQFRILDTVPLAHRTEAQQKQKRWGTNQ